MRRGRYRSFVIIAALTAQIVFASPRTQVKSGNQAAAQGNPDAAMTHYKRALDQKGDSSVVLYDVGNVLYQSGQYEPAMQAFGNSLLSDPDPKRQSETLYNMGNSLFQAQKYDKAVASYIEALKRNPADYEAKYNLELAKRMLREQQQQQQQQQKNDQQQNQQEQQQEQSDSQKQDQEKDQENQQPQPQQEQQQQNEEERQTAQGQQQQMSKDEAERLLNALLQNEQNTLKDARKVKIAARGKREKDW